jgi:hypothetical protein
MSRVYVHEDRLGPYARMEWSVAAGERVELQPNETQAQQMQKLKQSEGGVWLKHLPFDGAGYDYPNDAMQVYAAIVPLYPKLRLSALGLLKSAGDLVPTFRRWQEQSSTGSARVELHFQLSGDYLRDIMKLGVQTPGRVGRLCTQAVFSRYVGVARFYDESGALLDAIYDTTDVLRHEPSYSRLIGLLALVEPYSASIKKFVAAEVPHGIAE